VVLALNVDNQNLFSSQLNEVVNYVRVLGRVLKPVRFSISPCERFLASRNSLRRSPTIIKVLLPRMIRRDIYCTLHIPERYAMSRERRVGQSGKGSPPEGAPCGAQSDYWFRLVEEMDCPRHSRYIGLHRPNALKKRQSCSLSRPCCFENATLAGVKSRAMPRNSDGTSALTT
jgi:hypothetical protein